MFGIGPGELLVIAILAIVVVGPRRMPTLMQSLGKAMREFRRASRDLQSQVGLDEALRDDDYRYREPARAPASAPAATPTATASDTTAHEYPLEGVDIAETRVHKADGE